MSARCFMVDSVMDCFLEGGGNNVGAMCWHNHEIKPYDTDPRPLPHLGVMTPAGLVCLYCPDTDPPHGHWTISGIPPVVTVTPSLNVNNEGWHGFLTEGVLAP